MIGALIRRENRNTRRMSRDNGGTMMHVQAKEAKDCWQPPETKRKARNRSFSEVFMGRGDRERMSPTIS